MKTNSFFVMWDIYGLECLIDLNKIKFEREQWEKQKVWNCLRGFEYKAMEPGVPFSMLIMRAKANPQRHYEIYSITTDESINYDNMLTLFKEQPQFAANLVRQKGNQIYCDRQIKKAVIT